MEHEVSVPLKFCRHLKIQNHLYVKCMYGAKLFLRQNIWMTGPELIYVNRRFNQIKFENTLGACWEKVDESKK